MPLVHIKSDLFIALRYKLAQNVSFPDCAVKNRKDTRKISLFPTVDLFLTEKDQH